jgi:5-methylcytosine-specific restriction endonuclease McrA
MQNYSPGWSRVRLTNYLPKKKKKKFHVKKNSKRQKPSSTDRILSLDSSILKESCGKTWSEYLKSRTWAVISYLSKRKDGFHCRRCRSTKKLNTHHCVYAKKGEEKYEDLMTLCSNCHTLLHKALKLQFPEIELSSSFLKTFSYRFIQSPLPNPIPHSTYRPSGCHRIVDTPQRGT